MDAGMNFDQLIIGGHKIAVSRYRHYKVAPDRQSMKIYLDQPREIVKVSKPENVAAALLEIEAAFTPSDRGWKDL